MISGKPREEAANNQDKVCDVVDEAMRIRIVLDERINVYIQQ